MVIDENRGRAIKTEVPGVGLGRRPRLWLSAAIVALVFLGYSVPFYGLPIWLAIPIALLVVRREFWGAAVPRSALLAVLVWVGLWLPAISYFFTGWYWLLTGDEISTGWLLIPLCGPVPYVVGTVVPATAATPCASG